VADLLDGDLANVHMGTVALGIRNVLCVPLRLVRYVDKAENVGEERRIGVLYLDSKEKGSLLSGSTRAALETLATEAAVAIENARLYRETMEKARMEQEMRIAAEIQQALLPRAARAGSYFRAAAASLPCRSIGGDFYDYVEMGNGALGFALGDVAGKGPPAALLSAMMQGIFAAQAATNDEPSETITRVNLALCRRGIESRFVTLMYGVLDAEGQMVYCNAGHNPPLIIGSGGVRRLERGGPIVGLFETATYEEERLRLTPGDWLIIFSDGISEAMSATGDEYGESRIIDCIQRNKTLEPPRLLDALFSDVREFARGAPQSDDITAMVLRYGAS
jgi:sigma-B regulation protein RsbU (phosphoserine phosphatase)